MTSAQGARGRDFDALDQRGLLGVRRGHDHLQVPGPGGGPPPAAPPTADRAVQPQFAEQHQPVDRVRGNGAVLAARIPAAIARSKPLPAWAGRRGQADRDPPQRKLPAALTTAARTRSTDWRTTASGSPPATTCGTPAAMSASTSTMAPCTPATAHRPGAGEGHRGRHAEVRDQRRRDGRTRMPTTSNRRSGACSSCAASHRARARGAVALPHRRPPRPGGRSRCRGASSPRRRPARRPPGPRCRSRPRGSASSGRARPGRRRSGTRRRCVRRGRPGLVVADTGRPSPSMRPGEGLVKL